MGERWWEGEERKEGELWLVYRINKKNLKK